MKYRCARILDWLALVVVIPFVLQLVVYYGFFSNYTRGVFSEAGFLAQYTHGIYRYRLLGSRLLLELHHFLELHTAHNFFPLNLVPYQLTSVDPGADAAFYNSIFLFNSLALLATSGVLYRLWRSRRLNLPDAAPTHLLALALLAMSQFVVTPYDVLAIFFLCAVMLCLLEWSTSPGVFVVALILLLLGTLTRETTLLVIPFAIALDERALAHGERGAWTRLALLAAVFIATYLLLRWRMGFDAAFYQGRTGTANLGDPKSMGGLVFLIAVAGALTRGAQVPRRCALFLILTLPYVIWMFMVAQLWEIRLWLPILIPLLVLRAVRSDAVSREMA